MAGRKKAERDILATNEIPLDVIGAVVAADLCQIEADGKTHPDPDAQRRILFAVNRLREIAHGELSPQIVAAIPQIQEILAKT
jgi:hypothetical protein